MSGIAIRFLFEFPQTAMKKWISLPQVSNFRNVWGFRTTVPVNGSCESEYTELDFIIEEPSSYIFTEKVSHTRKIHGNKDKILFFYTLFDLTLNINGFHIISNNILINIHFFLFKNLCYIVHRNNILIIYFYKYEAG